jgi:uncharacterized protein
MSGLPPRLNFVTLACRDIDGMARLLRAFGWPEAPSSEEQHRVFQLSNGVVLALFGAENYESGYGPRADGFRGFTLGVNLGSRDEVLEAHGALQQVEGVEGLGEPVDSPHGFTGFSFHDPEGNVWDVAWAEGSTVDERGGLTFP